MPPVVPRMATWFDCMADEEAACSQRTWWNFSECRRPSVRFYHRGASSHHKTGAVGQQVLCSYLCLTTFTSTHEAVGDQDSPSTLTVFPSCWLLTKGLMEKLLLLYLSSVAFTGKPLIYFSSLCCLCVWQKFESICYRGWDHVTQQCGCRRHTSFIILMCWNITF